MNWIIKSVFARVVASLASLYIFGFAAIEPIRGFLNQGQVDTLASELKKVFPEMSALEFSLKIVPIGIGFLVGVTFLLAPPLKLSPKVRWVLSAADLLVARLPMVVAGIVPFGLSGKFEAGQIIAGTVFLTLPFVIGALYSIAVLMSTKTKPF